MCLNPFVNSLKNEWKEFKDTVDSNDGTEISLTRLKSLWASQQTTTQFSINLTEYFVVYMWLLSSHTRNNVVIVLCFQKPSNIMR